MMIYQIIWSTIIRFIVEFSNCHIICNNFTFDCYYRLNIDHIFVSADVVCCGPATRISVKTNTLKFFRENFNLILLTNKTIVR